MAFNPITIGQTDTGVVLKEALALTTTTSGIQFLPVVETVSVGMAVGLTPLGIEPYDVTSLEHMGQFIGICITNSNPGELAQVNTTRRTSLPLFGLTPSTKYYAGLKGRLTTLPQSPGAVFTHSIGVALTTTDLLVLSKPLIRLTP